MGKRTLVLLLLSLYGSSITDGAETFDKEIENINCIEDGFLPHPKNCRAFYWCSLRRSSRALILECDDDQIFDSESRTCTYPWLSSRQECGGTLHLSNEVEQIKGRAFDDAPFAKIRSAGDDCQQEGFMSHWKDCTKFYRCVDGGKGQFIKYDFSCASGTVWDTKTNSCNHPWAVEDPKCGTGTAASNPSNENYKPSVEYPNPIAPAPIPHYPPAGYNPYPETLQTGINHHNPDEAYNPNLYPVESEQQGGSPIQASYPNQQGGYNPGTYPNRPGGEYLPEQTQVGYNPGTDSGSDQGAGNKPTYPNQETSPATESSTTTKSPPTAFTQGPSHSVSETHYTSTPSITDNEIHNSASDNECKHDGFIGDSTNCKKFYRCVESGKGGFIRYEFTCGEGTVWDSEIKACNHRWAVKNDKCRYDQSETSGGGNEIANGPGSTAGDGGLGGSGDNGVSDGLGGSGGSSGDGGSEGPGGSGGSGDIDSSGGSGGINGSGESGGINGSGGSGGTDNSVGTGDEGGSEGPGGSGGAGNIDGSGGSSGINGLGGSGGTDNSEGSNSNGGSEGPSGLGESGGTNGLGESGGDGDSGVSGDNEAGQGIAANHDCDNEDFLPNKKDCKKFYRCVKQEKGYIKYEFNCGEGTVWDQNEKTCNFPWATKGTCGMADSSNNGIETTTADHTSGSTYGEGTTTSSITVSSTEKKDEGISSITTQSTGIVSIESNTEKKEEATSNKQTESTSIISTESSTEKKEEATSSKTTESFSIISASSTEKTEEATFDKTTESIGSISIESSTEKNEGTTFSKAIESTSINTTSEYYTTSSPQGSTIKPTETTGTHHYDKCKEEGFIGDSQNCKKFYRCVENEKGGFTKYDFSCGEGTVWDVEQTTCNYPWTVTGKCKDADASGPQSEVDQPSNETVTETTSGISGATSSEVSTESVTSNGGIISSTESSSSSDQQTNDCTKDGFFGDAKDCKKFYRCVDNGKGRFTKYEFSCGEGTVWDNELNTCNYPWAVKNSKCDTKGSSESETTSSGIENISQNVEQTSELTTSDKEPSGEITTKSSEQTTSSLPNSSQTTDSSLTTETTNEQGSSIMEAISTEKSEQSSTETTEGNSSVYNSTTDALITPESTTSSNQSNPSTTAQITESTITSSSLTSEETSSMEASVTPDSSSTQSLQPTETTATTSSHIPKSSESTTTSPPTPELSTSSIESSSTVLSSSTSATITPELTTISGESTTEKYKPSTTAQTTESTAISTSSTSEETYSTEVSVTPDSSSTQSPQPTEITATTFSQISELSSSETSHKNDSYQTTPSSEFTTPSQYAPATQNKDNKCTAEGFFPNVNNCNKFYRCVSNGKGYTKYDFNCGGGTIWDPDIDTCNHPYAVKNKKCQEGQNKPPEKGENDTCTEDGFYPNSANCKKFYRCVDNGRGGYTKYDFTCGEGTIWDPNILSCNYPSATVNNACGHKGEVQVPSTTEKESKPASPSTITPETTSTYTTAITSSTAETEQTTTEAQTITTTEPDENATEIQSPITTAPQETTIVYQTIVPEKSNITTTSPEETTIFTGNQTASPEETTTEITAQTTTSSEQTTPPPEAETTEPNKETTTDTDMQTTEVTELTTIAAGEQTTIAETQQTTEETLITTSSSETATSSIETTTSSSEATTEYIATTISSSESPVNQTSASCPISQLEADQMALVCPTGFKRHPKYCNLFYQCTSDPITFEIKVLVISCPGIRIYDESRIQCLAPEETEEECRGEIAEKAQLRRFGHSVSPMEIEKEDPLCPNEGTFALDPKECDRNFIKCKRATTTERSMRGFMYQCPENHTYWPISKKCESQSNALNCGEISNAENKWQIPIEVDNVSPQARKMKL